jgi:4-hydroxy-tetrahydrodipicolinate synthase
MAPFGHLLTAMITPFTSSGEVDYEQTWRLARFLVDNGSDGLVVTGTTGESPTLSSEEKVALYRTVVEAVGSRAHVVAGAGTYDTAESVELARRAAEVGCDGVMAVTPYYSRPPQEGLMVHFTAVADASDLPLMVYNIPGRTGRRIEIETLERLADHQQIVAVKDAVGDLAFTTKTRVALGADFAIYSGDDINTLPMIAAGAIGVVSVASHLAGKQIKALVEAALANDLATATKLHLALAPLAAALFVEPSPMPVKAALNALWEPVGDPRSPLIPAADETVHKIREALGAVQGL